MSNPLHFRGWLAAFAYLLLGDTAMAQGDPHIDPFETILQRAVESLDESYESWNFRPEETVDSTTFTINYTASLSTEGKRRLDRVMILHADPNQDRMVTRDEARRFLEIQLGIRWVTDDLLRLDDGQLVDFSAFLRADTDQNDVISEREFVVAVWEGDQNGVDFSTLDADGDGELTLTEYAVRGGPNVRSMIDWFHEADLNGDARLGRSELVERTPINRQRLIDSNLSAFDEDGDGHLSLTEFRLSMLGNINYPWESLPRDTDHDDAISFDEFQFHGRDLFQLQKRLYFHRLDRNGDNVLTMDEFAFARQKAYSLQRISSGGEQTYEIYRNDRYPILGSPSISPDGRWVLCHAIPTEGEHRSMIVLMSADGGEIREVCDGLMPSWSGNGSRFACSRYEGGAGVWIMSSGGGAQRRIDDGWGAQWSPDGRSIAYTNDNSIRIYDVEAGESKVLLSKKDHPYRYLHPNLAWSPDSARLAFHGTLDRHLEIGIVTVDEPTELNRRFQTLDDAVNELSWTKDGQSLLLSLPSHRYGRRLIHQLAVNGSDAPVLFSDGGTQTNWEDVCVSRDGKFIVATSTR